ncbi:hypothetical protein [Paraburkholderia ginsengisoli]|uniref:Uncharacterized protein n=1 Tax=Paraburkholderia ginsengisoli TaxID=311231 RepID=A0A7T4N091_9BURK|nr:hypothetical protein [Paraburkholderia ginsengisoli]QQC62831.1 hypothetical protein I6I06_10920 [Paraburkholderia ginsengisoli]
MASQVGNVSRVGKCAKSSTKCANGGVSMDGAKARNSSGESTEIGGAGLDGQRTAQECGSGDQHACRLHVIHDARKSGFYPASRNSRESTVARSDALGRFAVDYRACLPLHCAARSLAAPESSA